MLPQQGKSQANILAPELAMTPDDKAQPCFNLGRLGKGCREETGSVNLSNINSSLNNIEYRCDCLHLSWVPGKDGCKTVGVARKRVRKALKNWMFLHPSTTQLVERVAWVFPATDH